MHLRSVLVIWLIATLSSRADEQGDADAKLLREQKVGVEDEGLRAFLRKRTPTKEELATIDTLVDRLGARSFAVRQKAHDELLKWGPAAIEALRRAMASMDLEISRRAERCVAEISQIGSELPRAAVRQLTRNKTPDALTVLLAYVPHADDDEVTEAVLAALLQLHDPKKVSDLLLLASKDAAPARRAAAAHVLGRHASDKAREAATKLLADPMVKVRFRAAQALLIGHDKKAVPVLIQLLGETAENERWQVEELLARLPGTIKGEPALPLPPADQKPESSKKYRDDWLRWWEQHGANADLAKLDDRPGFLNVTLVPEMHARKVWEYGPDGKVRWELTQDLRNPIDAQVLNNGRVLIAELDGRVTERDRTGRIVWEHKVQTPIYCRRMPNGNTFISTNHACFIVTPAGKEVFRYEAEGGFFIHSIQQMPTGQIVCISMNGDVREIAPDGKVVRTIPLEDRGSWSGIEGLPGGRYLCVGGGKIREIDTTGKVIWKLDVPSACYATRLPSGNTLVVVNNNRGLVEVTRDGKTVGEKAMGTSLWRVHRR